MNGVVFDPDARAEFLAAVEYYEECQSGLGRCFRSAVKLALHDIESMPFACCMTLFADASFRSFLTLSFSLSSPASYWLLLWHIRSKSRATGMTVLRNLDDS